jgi:hypothetical protein
MLLSELKFKLQTREHSQAQDLPSDMPTVLHNLISKAWVTHSQVTSSGDLAALLVPPVYLEDTGIIMEQGQEPWALKHALKNWKNKNFTPTERRLTPLRSKRGKCRSKGSGLETPSA